MSQRDRDQALAAIAEPLDFTGAVVETEPSRAKVVHSVRLDPELSQRLEAEAVRRGKTPSAVLRELVETGLTETERDATVTIRLSDLHRAIDSVAQRAA
jgi:predicted DNA-binding protein